MRIQDNYVNCAAHPASEGQLLIGKEKTAIIDCGMAFCAMETIAKIKAVIGERSLDYVLASHTHYDHIGALPWFREEWQGVKLVSTEIGATVLLKDTPRRVIRELSQKAGEDFGREFTCGYDDDAMRADLVVKDGDEIDLGGMTVRIIETPGHTRDSLSFIVPELGLLYSNETNGVLLDDGTIYPTYLVSYDSALDSIERCGGLVYRYLALPHRGVVENASAEGFFDRAKAVVLECMEFVWGLEGLEEEEKIARFEERYYSDALAAYQPREAFLANAKATLKLV